MRILGFDTSAKAASVALSENRKLISEFYLDSGFTHSETVLPMAKAVLDSARITPADVDLFAVNCGPGSFTGLRIGIAAVKALGMSLGKPCAAVSTLEALAYRLANKVIKTKRSVKLEPMNPYERKVIHAALHDHPKVMTRSEGQDPYRRVVIELK